LDIFSTLREAVLAGEVSTAVSAVRRALDAGAEPLVLITRGITPALEEAGQLFEKGEYFVPELLVSARATKAVFGIIRPLLARTGVQPAGRVVLGTVRGDVHDIGKSLVAAMLEGGGFEVIDLGVDVPPERFVAAVEQGRAGVVGLSALLTTTMPAMGATIEALRAAGVRQRVKVIIGGAPVTARYAETIGADGYAESAAAVVGVVRRLTGTRGPGDQSGEIAP
jgi:5-methyltetrahydrofolate--homocysteine methyltransferase